MDDWKSRIDVWEARKYSQAEAKAKTKQDKAEQLQAKPRPLDASQRRWGQAYTLAAHQRRFRCHVCRKPSDGPQTYHTLKLAWVSRRKLDDTGAGEGVEHVQHVNWNVPTGLSRCSRCHAWTCAEHLYKGVCQTCAYKL